MEERTNDHASAHGDGHRRHGDGRPENRSTSSDNCSPGCDDQRTCLRDTYRRRHDTGDRRRSD